MDFHGFMALKKTKSIRFLNIHGFLSLKKPEQIMLVACAKENKKAGSKDISHARRQDGSADLTRMIFARTVLSRLQSTHTDFPILVGLKTEK